MYLCRRTAMSREVNETIPSQISESRRWQGCQPDQRFKLLYESMHINQAVP